MIAENQRHDHPPESMQKIVSKVVDKMKDRAKNETTSVNVIYREALQEVNENPDLHEAAAVLPTLPSLQSSLYRKRRERLPPLPLTRDEVEFTGDWAKTSRGDVFLLAAENNIHIFATEQNLQLLAEAETST